MTIDIKNLSKKYGNKEVLSNLTFQLQPGITAVVGHNGAGKSTLFNILSGRISDYNGFITINGSKDTKYKKNILFEESYFYPHLTAKENLKYINYCHEGKSTDKEIDKLMQEWDVCTDKNKPLSHYSLGMKKRYSIAAALINNPDILILDEPQNGLDIDAQKLVANLFDKFRKEKKIILFSSHQMENVISLADRIIILHNGKIKMSCPLEDLEQHSDIILIKADKNEIMPFLKDNVITYDECNSDLLNIRIKREKIFDFLDIIARNKIHIYKLETILPSLIDILNEIEETKL